MTKQIIIGIDSGASATKAKSPLGSMMFATKMTEGFTQGMIGENTFNTTINGVDLTIGDKAEISDKREGKDTDLHIYTTLVAAAKLRGDADEIIVGYGESFNKYMQPEQKERIKAKLQGEHTVIFYNNGIVEEHHFTIKDIHLLPEGLGTVLCDLENNLGLKYIVDWGGSTINFLEVFDGQPTSKSDSFRLGSYNVYAKVGSMLTRASLGSYTDLQIKSWVDEGCSNVEIQKIIDKVIQDQLKEIDNRLIGLGHDLHEYLEVTFIGGTSKLFHNQIKSYYECAVFDKDSVMCNANGFYEYMRLVYGN